MIDKIARIMLPDKLRCAIGKNLLRLASRNAITLEMYLRLAHGYSLEHIRLLPRNEAEYDYKGCKILFPIDGIGSCFEVFNENVYDREYNISADDIVLDIGAYVGMWSVKAAYLAEKVIAIEPMVDNRRLLMENICGLPIIALPYVVSDRNGMEILYLSETSSSHSIMIPQKEGIEVPCRTLDTIIREASLHRVDFIKIDAEGAELKVIQGAEKTLQDNNVDLAIVAYHDSTVVPEIISLLNNWGFNVNVRKGLRRYIYAKKNN